MLKWKKDWNKKILMVVVVIIAIGFLEWVAIWGFLIFLLIMICWRVWKGRERVMFGIRMLETSIWKKPLDKDLWRKGEMKNTKVEFVRKVNGKIKPIRPITNGRMAALFFVLFVVFFIIFAYNKYTMNCIAAFICLIISMSFKTWAVIREVHEE